MKTATITTNRGIIRLYLTELIPNTVDNFMRLAREGFYNGSQFHRVLPNFMAQAGCSASGNPNAGYIFDDEFHPRLKHYGPGTLAMANAGPNTNSSQFYITHVTCSNLDDRYVVFGQVIEGMDVVHAIQQGDVIEKIEVTEWVEKVEA